MQILGLLEMKGTSKASGKPYDAVIVYGTEEAKGVVGVKTGDIWIPRDIWDAQIGDLPDSSLLGMEIYASYDRRGFLQKVEIH